MKTTTRLYEHLSLERFRPSAKRGWKRRLGGWLWTLIWMVLVSLALWGLFAWATGRVMPVGGLKPELRTAGFGLPERVAAGIVGVIAALVVWRLITGARDEQIDVEHLREHEPLGTTNRGGRVRPSFVGPPPPVNRVVQADWTGVSFGKADPLDGDTLKREQRAVEGMPGGLTRVDVALIVHACGCEVGLLRNLVRSAQKPLSEDDQAETLAVAERRLGQLRVTLWELRARFSESQGLPVSESSTEEASGKA